MTFINSNVPPIIFCPVIKKLKLGRLADSGDELNNVASNSEYQQIHMVYVYLFCTSLSFLHLDVLLRFGHILRRNCLL